MSAIPGFVTVRTTSTRLPGKCLLPFGDGTVLEHVIRRARHQGLDPVVCTTVEPADDVVEETAIREDARCFRGSVIDKMGRWRDCCRHFGIEAFHTVDADDPFLDGELMQESVRRLIAEGWDMVAPTAASSAGGASVGYSLTRDILERACAIAGAGADTEMMWYWVEKVPNLKKLVLPDTDPDPVRMRLTLDYEEDYWLLASVLRMVGGLASRGEVDDLFRRNPDLHKVNWFRNEDWAAGQAAKAV